MVIMWFGSDGSVSSVSVKAQVTNSVFAFSFAFLPEIASNCHELFLSGVTSSGVHIIQPHGGLAFNVYCEMTAEGGWTVIQKRHDGSVDFDQLWQAYQKGFGSLNGKRSSSTEWTGLSECWTQCVLAWQIRCGMKYEEENVSAIPVSMFKHILISFSRRILAGIGKYPLDDQRRRPPPQGPVLGLEGRA